MIILSKKVVVSKSAEEITEILKNSVSPLKRSEFAGDNFSMYCAKRRSWRYFSLVCVRGLISMKEDHKTVLLQVHANKSFFGGCFIALLGIGALVGSVVFPFMHWTVCIGVIGLGLLIGAQTLCDGIEILDLLEFKLTRSTEGG